MTIERFDRIVKARCCGEEREPVGQQNIENLGQIESVANRAIDQFGQLGLELLAIHDRITGGSICAGWEEIILMPPEVTVGVGILLWTGKSGDPPDVAELHPGYGRIVARIEQGEIRAQPGPGLQLLAAKSPTTIQRTSIPRTMYSIVFQSCSMRADQQRGAGRCAGTAPLYDPALT
jgi:hypothetical protein